MSTSAHINILVVDDVASMRGIIKNLLKSLGYDHIEEAEDGSAALEKIKHNHFDIVITDWIMPVMDGKGLLNAIRRDATLSQLPVLMITAEAKKENIIEAVLLGVKGCIVKPCSVGILEEKINKIIGKQAQQNDADWLHS